MTEKITSVALVELRAPLGVHPVQAVNRSGNNWSELKLADLRTRQEIKKKCSKYSWITKPTYRGGIWNFIF